LEKEFKIAQASTEAGETFNPDSRRSQYVINAQIKFWKDAKKEYEEYQKLLKQKIIPPEDWSYALSIILKLGISLTVLFGANYESKPGEFTPALKNHILKWKLEEEDKNLYDEFVELDEFHKNISKHFDISKVPILEKTSLDDLNKYMETTRKIWLWFLRKKTNGVIDPEVEKEFTKKYV
jgi:hypothetical protein